MHGPLWRLLQQVSFTDSGSQGEFGREDRRGQSCYRLSSAMSMTATAAEHMDCN